MPVSANLGMPFLEAGQAQKHVTLNEALRILDASIHLSVAAVSSSAPSSPDEAERHIVAAGAGGAFAGQANAIATFEDGAWRFLPPRTGWRAWVEAEDILYVFDGETWRDLRDLSVELDDVLRLGINTVSEGENRLAVRSNAALFHAVEDADGGSGDVRLQISKEAGPNTASVFFSNAFEGRAEFGLAGDDDFSLKVSADGESWVSSLVVSGESGAVALPLAADLQGAVSFSGDTSPPEITSDRNDYDPSGLSNASVLRLSSDASRAITGLAGGADGRIVAIHNAGSNAIVLKNEDAASSAANRFALAGNVTLAANECALLQYDAAASRWRVLASPSAAAGGSADLSPLHLAVAKLQMRVADLTNTPVNWIGAVSDSYDNTAGLNIGGSSGLDTSEAGVVKPSASGGSSIFTGGSVSASSTFSGSSASNAFDGNNATDWIANGSSNEHVQYQTASPKTAVKVKLRNAYNSGTGTYRCQNFSIRGSNDGSSWTTLYSGTLPANAADHEYDLTTPGSYTYYRLLASNSYGGANCGITEFHLFESPATNNLVAVSESFTLPAEPDSIDFYFVIEKINAMTPNTDYVASVSIDGGTNYDTGSIEELGTVGALTICRAASNNVSARTGTSFRWKIETHNNKNCKLHDIAARVY